LSRALLSGRGEASGVALARQLLDRYAGLPVSDRIKFFQLLGRDFGPDQPALRVAWNEYDKNPSPKRLRELLRAVEPPRQELFRMNSRLVAPVHWSRCAKTSSNTAASPRTRQR
jgi:malonyl-CoA decarboxylase